MMVNSNLLDPWSGFIAITNYVVPHLLYLISTKYLDSLSSPLVIHFTKYAPARWQLIHSSTFMANNTIQLGVDIQESGAKCKALLDYVSLNY